MTVCSWISSLANWWSGRRASSLLCHLFQRVRRHAGHPGVRVPQDAGREPSASIDGPTNRRRRQDAGCSDALMRGWRRVRGSRSRPGLLAEAVERACSSGIPRFSTKCHRDTRYNATQSHTLRSDARESIGRPRSRATRFQIVSGTAERSDLRSGHAPWSKARRRSAV